MPLRLLLPELIAASAMLGIIWLVQIAIYPLYSSVGARDFPAFHIRYTRLVTWVICPLMLMEAIFCAWLISQFPGNVLHSFAAVLLGIIWLSTAFVQVPAHRVLNQGWNLKAHRTLIRTNWLRTLAWSLRVGLLFDLVIDQRPLN